MFGSLKKRLKDAISKVSKTIKEEKLCHGVHIMAVVNEGIVPEIMEAAEVVSMPG